MSRNGRRGCAYAQTTLGALWLFALVVFVMASNLWLAERIVWHAAGICGSIALLRLVDAALARLTGGHRRLPL